MMYGPEELFGAIAADAIGRWVYRHRSAFVPLIVAGAAFSTALLIHPHHARYWILVAVVTVLGTVLLGISHQLWWSNPGGKATAGFLARMWAACGIDRATERAYAACVVAVTGGWLSVAIAIGPLVKPMPAVAAIAAVILGIPWWIHRRRRARVRVDRTVEAWPDISEAIGLAGSRVGSVVADAWGWTARVILRKGTSAEEAIAKISAIESGLGVRRGSVRVFPDDSRADAFILRVIETDPHSADITWPGTENTSITQPFELGLFEDGQPVLIRILRKHVLIGGIAGAGKSGILNIILAVLAACRDVEIWGVDLKGGMELKPWAICMNRLATTPEQANALFRDAVIRLNERAERMAREGKRVWEPTPDDPALVIVVDEYAELPEEAHDCTDSIARRGRAVAETLIVATQRPSQEAMGNGAVRSQMDIRICLRVRERRDVDLILGQGSFNAGWHAHALTKPGEFLVSDPEHARPERARAYLLTDARVAEHAREHSRVQLAGDVADAPEYVSAPPGWHQAAEPAPDPTEAWVGGSGDAEGALWAALRMAGPRGVSIADLIRATGKGRTWVYERIRQLADAGLVIQTVRGRWRAADENSEDYAQ